MRMSPPARRVRATLIHNPTAGDRRPGRETLVAELERAGYDVAYHSTKARALARALAEPGVLAVAAGGDGTIAKVAVALAGRDIPLAILPTGTANNIARSLGIVGGASHILAALEGARRRRLDVGVARGPWGERRFVEAAGVGLFARMLALLNAKEGAPLAESAKEEPGFRSALRLLHQLLADYPGREWRVTLDGRELGGRYLMLEGMNIPLIGPHLNLAPQADPGDGLLDVVLVPERLRDGWREYLERRLGQEVALPALPVHRGRRLELVWTEPEIHFDDDTWPEDAIDLGRVRSPAHPAPVTVAIETGRLWVDVLVPAP
jgi:diacylglycerol kinase (ATP)